MRTVGVAALAALMLFGAAAAAAAPKHAHSPSPARPLDAVHAAVRYDLDDKPSDPFTPAKTVSFEGRSFRLEIPFAEENTTDETTGWFYQNGQLRLSWGTKGMGFAVDDAFHDKGSWVGQNGFGATVTVNDYVRLKTYLEVVGEDNAPISVSFPMEGPKAKALVHNAVAVIEGTITHFPVRPAGDRNMYTTFLRDDGFIVERPVSCQTIYYGATFDSPSSSEHTTCHVAVKLTRISFRNRATGEVVWSQDWSTRTPQAAAAATPPAAPATFTPASAEDIERYYPERAMRMGISGSVELACTLNTQGRLDGCAVTSEAPADQGFGEAAVRLAKLAHGEPRATDAKVAYRVEFHPPS
jgi:TonB family protein